MNQLAFEQLAVINVLENLTQARTCTLKKPVLGIHRLLFVKMSGSLCFLHFFGQWLPAQFGFTFPVLHGGK